MLGQPENYSSRIRFAIQESAGRTASYVLTETFLCFFVHLQLCYLRPGPSLDTHRCRHLLCSMSATFNVAVVTVGSQAHVASRECLLSTAPTCSDRHDHWNQYKHRYCHKKTAASIQPAKVGSAITTVSACNTNTVVPAELSNARNRQMRSTCCCRLAVFRRTPCCTFGTAG